MMKKRTILLFLVGILSLILLISCSCDKEERTDFEVEFQTYVDNIAIPSQNVGIDGYVTYPTAEMKRPGYNFKGWYLGEKKWDFEKDTVTKDMTLTAKWEAYLSYAEAKDTSGGLWVVGCDFKTTEIVIPSEHNGRKVTGIYWAFAGRTKIKSIEIPDTVTYISSKAFNKCESLESITIPKGVATIGPGAFSLCDSLKEICCEAEEKPQGWHESFNMTEAQVSFNK